MEFLDPKFRTHWKRYVFQCLMASVTILVVLLFLDVIKHTAIIATLGASAFIVFTMPLSYSSAPRPLIGGYAIGIAIGIGCHFLAYLAVWGRIAPESQLPIVFFAAAAVGVVILLMTVANAEHPPAAGMALGLVMNRWDWETLCFILAAVLFLIVVRVTLRKHLIDLT